MKVLKRLAESEEFNPACLEHLTMKALVSRRRKQTFFIHTTNHNEANGNCHNGNNKQEKVEKPYRLDGRPLRKSTRLHYLDSFVPYDIYSLYTEYRQ